MAQSKSRNGRLGVNKVADQEISRQQLSKLERQARREARQSIRVAHSSTGGMGGFSGYGSSPANITDAHQSFYSPQLSTDFLELPQSEREKRELFRFWVNTNPIVGAAMDFHTDIPLSKIRLSLPKGKDRKRNKQILHFYEQMCKRVQMFQTLYDATREYWIQGNCYDKSRSFIRTSHGLKRGDDMKVGDLVLTNAGRFRPVIKICSRICDHINDIWTQYSNLPLPLTDEHPVEVFSSTGSGSIWTLAGNISVGDYVRITWPTEVIDTSCVTITDPDRDVITDGGYVRTRTFSVKRQPQASVARSALIKWVSGLKCPVIVSRSDLAEQLGVKIFTLHNVISQLHKETDLIFHRQIGCTKSSPGSRVEWIPANIDVQPSDDYSSSEKHTYSTPTTIAVDDDFLYLIGYWLGDGTLTHVSKPGSRRRHFWRLVFGRGSEAQAVKCRQILARVVGLKYVHEVIDNRGLLTMYIGSHPAWIEWWGKNFGETSHGSNPKKIPDWVMNLPPGKQLSVVAGLLDSDGCLSQKGNQHITIDMTSQSLVESARIMLLRNGIVPAYRTRKAKTGVIFGRITNMRQVYSMTITRSSWCRHLESFTIKKFPVSVQKPDIVGRAYMIDGGNVYLRVSKVERRSGLFDVGNIEVEEDNTFQVNGYSTHNCFIFAEDHDMRPEIPDSLTMDVTEEEIGEIDYAGRAVKKKVKKANPKPVQVQHEAITEYVAKNYRGWERLQIFPPEQVKLEVFQYTNKTKMELIPSEKDRLVVLRAENTSDPEARKIADDIPEMIREKLLNGQPIPLETSPYADFFCSSFCFHLAHKKAPYDDRGTSILERCLRTLLQSDKLRQAQASIASRAMTPKRVIWGDKMSDQDVDGIRDQIDQATQDPDFAIIANFELHWDEIGSRDRLLDLSSENEHLNKMLFIGLRITESMLTGDATYAGERIHLDVMNTMYLLYRETISRYVEEQLFAPVAEKKGFFEIDEDGNRVLLYPKLQFTRLALRDNTELQDFMYNLYQKGSLPIAYIYDLLNIDVDDAHDQLQKDAFTLKDANMNELIRAALTSIGDTLSDDTDVKEKVFKSLGLKKQGKKGDRFGGEGSGSGE